MKKKKNKKNKKTRRRKKIRKKARKKIPKVNLKKIKGLKIGEQIKMFKKMNLHLNREKISRIGLKTIKSLKIGKQIEQFKELNLQLKRKKNRIISKQMNRLKGFSLKKSASLISQSFNNVYEDFKKQRKIQKLKQIKHEKREKERRIKKEKQKQKRISPPASSPRLRTWCSPSTWPGRGRWRAEDGQGTRGLSPPGSSV